MIEDIKLKDPNFYEKLYNIIISLNDKKQIQETVFIEIDNYKTLLEAKLLEKKNALENQVNVNKDQNFDYIQGTLDFIGSYMTPKNIFIGLGCAVVTLSIIWALNAYTGAATTKIIEEVANKGINEMQKSINNTQQIVKSLQEQQIRIVEDNTLLHKEITNIYSEINNKNLEVFEQLSKHNTSVYAYIKDSETRFDMSHTTLNSLILNTETNLSKVVNTLSELDNRVNTLIEAVSMLRDLLNTLREVEVREVEE